MKLLMVVPRYGADVLGGAETLVRGLATRASGDDMVIDVATTCATDHETWANALPAGESVEEGVRVSRFPVSPRDEARHAELLGRLAATGRLDYLDEVDLMATSVWSAGLQEHLERRGGGYDLIVFAPYLFGTTYWGLQAWPERSALLPCLHDEPYAHMGCIRDAVAASAGCLFNTAAEERLARRLYPVRAGGVVGAGFDVPAAPPPPGFAARHGLGRYVLYAGRLEQGKRVDVAVSHLARFAAANAPDLRIALMGRGSYRVPDEHRRFVVPLGFVSEQDKRAAYAGAVALVNPSELESLSLVLLEAWLEGTPALVAAGSEVMRDHVETSGGGFTFAGYDDFAAGLTRLAGDPRLRAQMGARGRRYVEETCSWEAVSARLRDVAGAIAGGGGSPGPRRP